MDASPDSSVFSCNLSIDQVFQRERASPSFEGALFRIVAAGPDQENGLLTYIRVLAGVFNLRPWMSFEMPRGL